MIQKRVFSVNFSITEQKVNTYYTIDNCTVGENKIIQIFLEFVFFLNFYPQRYHNHNVQFHYKTRNFYNILHITVGVP